MSNGIGNKIFNETKINYLQSETDTTFISKATNASIVLGNDKPGGRFSGHGGVGDNSCATIDIVAGRVSPITQEKQDVNTYYSDNNFILDAARIYISQMTDIDDNFSIVDGKIGNSKNKSSIGMKADNIRIIARSGIKLVTKTDSTNSAGEEIVSNSGVDIIALNDDSNLQPMVL